MAKAIFVRVFNYSSPTQNVGWSASPSPKAQTFPREFIDAAVEAGAAERVPPRRRKTASAPTTQKGREGGSSKGES